MRIPIRDPLSLDPGSVMEKTRIRDKHPGAAALSLTIIQKVSVSHMVLRGSVRRGCSLHDLQNSKIIIPP
jgi:hypothetical protein